jgi:4-hydroxybenzoate polyprenyltransferase
MAAHTALGYLLAVGVGGAARGEKLGALGLGLVIWVLLLNGGTLAINSAFDRDEGDIGYLKAPPPPPRWLWLFALVLLLLGQGLAFLLPRPFTVAYAACLVMSLVYSVPPFRLKAVAGFDWLINMIGFGTLTPLAGYLVTGAVPSSAHLLVLVAFCPLFASLYPLTQLYQFEEDSRRGDRTLALILGMHRSLQVAIAAAVIAFLLFFLAGRLSGWGTGGADLVRWGGLVASAAVWAHVLLPWFRHHEQMAPRGHQAGMYAALRAWAVTDVVVILAWGLYT